MNLYFLFLFIPPAACTTKLLDKLFGCKCSLTVLFALVDFVPANQSNLVKKLMTSCLARNVLLTTSSIFFVTAPCFSLYSSIDYCLF